MSPPGLADLPVEIFQAIVACTLPEGFEGLALTCKAFYELCTPFFAYHKHLGDRFRHITYHIPVKPSWGAISSSFSFLEKIADQPWVARYVIDAQLWLDSYPFVLRAPVEMPGIGSGDPLISLLSTSPYLKEAGLDWKYYYYQIAEEFEMYSRHSYYSQHAAEFLLTHLPNARTLRLPELWEPQENAGALLATIVRKAQQLPVMYDNSGLAQVTRLELVKDKARRTNTGLRNQRPVDLVYALPFLALPHVKTLYSEFCFAKQAALATLGSESPYRCYGQALNDLYLMDACIDDATIAELLRHTPCLKRFRYRHKTYMDGDYLSWDPCRFATAIEREVGGHLEELHIEIGDLRGRIMPGRAALRGFKRLHRLGLPIEILSCNFGDAKSRDAQAPHHNTPVSQPFVGDFVPGSVTRLDLQPKGELYETVLKALFSGFAAKRKSHLPQLNTVSYCYPEGVHRPRRNTYKETCSELKAELEAAGVVLRTNEDDYDYEVDSGKTELGLGWLSRCRSVSSSSPPGVIDPPWCGHARRLKGRGLS
ncbi:F-box domain protein [Xylariaceae sp. FL0804]|nr:F-box domain protein [Xylariaceae sp. FL0804]